MYQSFTPNASVVAVSARAFAKGRGDGYVDSEHLLYAFSSGVGGDIIKTALEICGLSEAAVSAAIDAVSGGKHPHANRRQKMVNPALAERHTGMAVPMTTLAQLHRVSTTLNMATVLKMAEKETATMEPSFEDILYVLLREAGRGDDNPRILQVIELAAPNLEIATIKWVIGTLRSGTPEQAQIDIDRLNNTVTIMKHTRHALTHVPGAVQTA